MKDEVLTLIKDLEEKKKPYDDCVSSKEVLLVREWNNAINECINTIIDMYKN